MNGFYVIVFAFTIWGACVLIPAAIRYDRNLTAFLESLDDEDLAESAAEAWNRGEWS